ncbi:pentatricopeptide repeat-containing protein At5g67570, chloroplastic isoform X2 [Malania oleifera]|uniref:pentatricopeptide repeat-containing protein At5g67570, chloroplastic isoform X2 n=1 Tax=Malania oleifera TaxID=397392 RepID=UPI0025AE5218|nr:pentatricopeptide repeat-containing protein At5g67570, chloroplastic isoform X2 [Malania oleifera]
MEASTGAPPASAAPIQPDVERIKRRLLRKGVFPTPKIIHTLRKKEIQKSRRKAKRLAAQTKEPPLSESQEQALAEEAHFQTLTLEYRDFTRAVKAKTKDDNGALMVGTPWEGLERVRWKELSSASKEYGGDRPKVKHLRELGDFLEQKREELRWLLDDVVEVEERWLENGSNRRAPVKRRGTTANAIRFLIERLSRTDLNMKDWKFAKMMKQSGLQFTEAQLLNIVEGLGANGRWRQALSVVEWVYSSKDYRHYKSKFVYTKLLAVLGKARRPHEALHIFNLMKVLNACVPSRQWKGVFWVFQQLRKCGLRPNGATYGLAMEVMLHSEKYDLVHGFFGRMRRSGEAVKALTYKVLVKAYWEEGKINEAVGAVKDMEQRGVVGTAGVYYELACCLCNHGMWQDAMFEVGKLKKLPHTKPLEFSFTGMIMSAMDGGHVDDCISIFEHAKEYCNPNIGMINVMLKVYGKHDMFSKAKELFEETKRAKAGSVPCLDDGASLVPDLYTYSSMLEACGRALQWEYFEYVYRKMTLAGLQLDQNKHASLLVEASRAGKWHLLEHSFDTILEAGEIPHPSFFTEMVIQAIAQHDCERAITLTNAMAYAPFQVSEEQWRDLFKKNGDRFSRDSLEKLLDSLCNCDVAREASVANLSKSLVSLCGSGASKCLPGSVDFGNKVINKPVSDDDDGGFDGTKGVKMQNLSRRGENPDLQGDLPVDSNGDTFGLSSLKTGYEREGDDKVNAVSKPPNGVGNEDGMSSLPVNSGVSAEGRATSGFADYFDDKSSTCNASGDSEFDVNEVEPDVLGGEVDDWDGNKLPSANEILASWEESRKKNGIFFPSQLGKK